MFSERDETASAPEMTENTDTESQPVIADENPEASQGTQGVSRSRSVTMSVSDWEAMITALSDSDAHNDLYFSIDSDLEGKPLDEQVTFALADEECAALGISLDSVIGAEDNA